MTTMTHVWVVESLDDDTPTLLSVHTDKESAYAARAAYIKDYRHGGTEANYWVHALKLNFTGLENGE
jgi:hypothetical protein